MTHPEHVIGYDGDLEELSEAIGNMRYDCVAKLLEYMSETFSRQAEGDKERNRPQLAGKLGETSSHLKVASIDMYQVWGICKPHMQDSKK